MILEINDERSLFEIHKDEQKIASNALNNFL
jgi:hypothetical protein